MQESSLRLYDAWNDAPVGMDSPGHKYASLWAVEDSRMLASGSMLMGDAGRDNADSGASQTSRC